MTVFAGNTRIAASATCLSWIPPQAVEGAFKLPFSLGVTHYDAPPPHSAPDVDGLLAADAIRFANRLQAWIDVTDGQITSYGIDGGGRLGTTTVRLASRVITFAGVAMPDLTPPPEVYPDRIRFTQTAGGHTGAAVPRRISHPPFVRLSAPLAWSTIVLTIWSDGFSRAELAAASPFPRHYLYDTTGRLTVKSALIRYRAWLRRSDRATSPWAGAGEAIPLAPVRSGVEGSLADSILVSGGYRQYELPAGAMLADLPVSPCDVRLLLDGLLVVEVDGRPAIDAGPGAIFDPAIRAPESKQHVTVRAKTRCRLAVVPRDQLDSQALLGVAAQQTWRLQEQVS
jgi:hypothetical protein